MRRCLDIIYKSEMIRDRLVVGIRDGVLSERLQMEADLTLEKAKKMIRQREAVHEQQSALKGATEPNNVATINNARTSGSQQRRDSLQPKFRQAPTPTGPRRSCTLCGREAHPREKCPAINAECHRCKRKGHYGAMYRSKTVASSVHTCTTTISQDEDIAFLDNLSPSNQETVWSATIQVAGKDTTFKLDTGAEVTPISTTTHQYLGKPHLDTSDKILSSRQPLQVVGQFTAALSHKSQSSQQKVYVVTGLKTNILGLPAITALSLAARMTQLMNVKVQSPMTPMCIRNSQMFSKAWET